MGVIPKNRLQIEVGQRFGELTIIKELPTDELWRRRFLCQCDCGGTIETLLYCLTQGKCTHCNNKVHVRRKNAQKYIGQRYGKLVGVEYVGYNEKNHSPIIRCQCDCGNATAVQARYLVKGETKSCGCNKHHVFDWNITHGFTASNADKNDKRLYIIWQGMNRRCNDAKFKGYRQYGGRGITVCNEWKYDFLAFREWALKNGYEETLTIDRKNVNGNYEPSNCRWITWQEQADNRQNTIWITHDGETHTIREWSSITGIKLSTLRSRYRMNFPEEDLFFDGSHKELCAIRKQKRAT